MKMFFSIDGDLVRISSLKVGSYQIIDSDTLLTGCQTPEGFRVDAEYEIHDMPLMSEKELERFKEIYSACSSGSIDSLDEPLKSDYWFVLQILQSLLTS